MKNIQKPVLVLDKAYMPLNVVPAKKALRYLLTKKATVIEETDNLSVLSANAEWSVPSVIRISNFVGQQSFSKIRVKFNKRSLIERDKHRCQYCDKVLSMQDATVDHVIPKGGNFGGQTNWTNCVIACQPCNAKKGNRTPEQAKMPLSRPPKYPSYMVHLSRVLEKHVKDQDSWKKYFIL